MKEKAPDPAVPSAESIPYGEGTTRIAPWRNVAKHHSRDQTLISQLNERFQVQRELGAGGMGVVYLATDRALERPVALKAIRPENLEDTHWLDRFLLEATVSAGLQHPNIVQVYEILQADGRPVLVMEYVEGTDLMHALQPGAVNEAEMTRILAQVCDGLAFAHTRGVIHRDIKPGNIMLGVDGVPKIADFGLATQRGRRSSAIIDAEEQGSLLGSPGYMSPEQARGDLRAIDNRTDLYSLGATLYFALTGRSPVDGDSFDSVLDAVLNGKIRPPSQVRQGVNPDLEAVCLKALALRPEDRYASAAEIARDLRSALSGRPLLARSYGRWETVRRAIAQKRAVFTLGVAAVILSFVGIAASTVALHTVAKDDLFEAMREQVTDFANLAALTVEPGQIDAITPDLDLTAPAVRQLRSLLSAIRDRSADLRYVWIMRRSSTGSPIMEFVAGSGPRDTPGQQLRGPKEAPAKPGDTFDAARYPELLRGLDGPTADRTYVAIDQWGIALSGYAPIRDASGRGIAVLGVDMADVDLAQRFADLDRALLITLVLSAALSLSALVLIVTSTVSAWIRQRNQ